VDDFVNDIGQSEETKCEGWEYKRSIPTQELVSIIELAGEEWWSQSLLHEQFNKFEEQVVKYRARLERQRDKNRKQSTLNMIKKAQTLHFGVNTFREATRTLLDVLLEQLGNSKGNINQCVRHSSNLFEIRGLYASNKELDSHKIMFGNVKNLFEKVVGPIPPVLIASSNDQVRRLGVALDSKDNTIVHLADKDVVVREIAKAKAQWGKHETE
jgi:hypothetical protein